MNYTLIDLRDSEYIEFKSIFKPFDIEKDCKDLGISHKEYDGLIGEIGLDINSIPSSSAVVTKNTAGTVMKFRYKDEKRGKGKSGGFRVIILFIYSSEQAIPFHIYHKSGKRKKADLTEHEKKECTRILKELREIEGE